MTLCKPLQCVSLNKPTECGWSSMLLALLQNSLSARSICTTAWSLKTIGDGFWRNLRTKLCSSVIVLFQSDICVIDGSCFEDGDVNPLNASQVCRIGQQTTLWTVVTSKSPPLLSLTQNWCRIFTPVWANKKCTQVSLLLDLHKKMWVYVIIDVRLAGGVSSTSKTEMFQFSRIP